VSGMFVGKIGSSAPETVTCCNLVVVNTWLLWLLSLPRGGFSVQFYRLSEFDALTFSQPCRNGDQLFMFMLMSGGILDAVQLVLARYLSLCVQRVVN